MHRHSDRFVGGFSDNDGTLDFYLRINTLVDSSSTVLDLGAGRAAWFEDDTCEIHRTTRLLKGKVKKVIAADVDEAVLSNKASDEQILMKDGQIGLPEQSVDVIIADYVLEHVDDPETFAAQIHSTLKPGGWFCARTPHKYNYISIAASLVKNSSHASILRKWQPERKEIDVFPTAYKMNTLRDIRQAFHGWEDRSFIFRADPAYYLGRKFIYDVQAILHRLMPSPMCGNLFVFMKKP